MGKRHFPNWLRAYANYTQHSEAPDLFHFWTGVATIAGALRRQVWIDQRYFQWTPNFYIVFVGPPGVVTKSTTVRVGMHLLQQVPQIHFGPQSMTWQALTKSLSEARRDVPFGENFLPMSCITCAVSELGTFLRPDDKELVDVLVSLWDGQLEIWKRETKTSGSDEIVNPWINVIGCTTPSWLRENFPESMVGGGLASRIIFVYGDRKRHLVPYPADIIPDKHFEQEAERLIDDLIEIGEMKGEFSLDPEAKKWGKEWYEKHHLGERPDHLKSERFGGYHARKQTHIHKLAIVLSAAESNDLIITKRHLVAADQLLTAAEQDMLKVFESIGVAPMQRATQEVFNYIKAYKTISEKELWRRCMPIMDRRTFQEAINGLLTAEHVMQTFSKGDKSYRILR